MNLFFLAIDTDVSSHYYCNRHCIKIILELAQLGYTAHWCSNSSSLESCPLKPYKKTHVNHPLSLWTRQDTANYRYVIQMGLSLCRLYTHRYGKIHKTQYHLEWLSQHIPSPDPTLSIDRFCATKSIPKGCTPVPLCMPEQFYTDDLIYSYRLYYLLEKQRLFDYYTTTDYIELWSLRIDIPMAIQ